MTAASFAAIAAAAAAMRARRQPRARAAGEHRRALDGLRLLRRDRIVRVTIATAVGALVFISAALTVEIFYVKDVVGASDSGYALVVCAWMAGMVSGPARWPAAYRCGWPRRRPSPRSVSRASA